ncbi:guanine nucleotide-binding protein [Sarcoptes scabiei]|nr:guanine nucleotide-binding protein [Sarcoptes scabiei]
MNNNNQSLPTIANYSSPLFAEYQLMKELIMFKKKEILHVYITPSHRSTFKWFGIMFVHRGLYRGKIMRFSISIGSAYPNCDIPRINFNPIPIHPLVDDQTGLFNLSTKFSRWNSACNYIYELIAYINDAFNIESLDELKQIANVKMFDIDDNRLKINIDQEMNEKFNRLVIEMSEDDQNFIHFDTVPENNLIIDEIKQRLLTKKSPKANCHHISMIDGVRNLNLSTSTTSNPRNYSTPTLQGLSWAKKIILH